MEVQLSDICQLSVSVLLGGMQSTTPKASRFICLLSKRLGNRIGIPKSLQIFCRAHRSGKVAYILRIESIRQQVVYLSTCASRQLSMTPSAAVRSVKIIFNDIAPS